MGFLANKFFCSVTCLIYIFWIRCGNAANNHYALVVQQYKYGTEFQFSQPRTTSDGEFLDEYYSHHKPSFFLCPVGNTDVLKITTRKGYQPHHYTPRFPSAKQICKNPIQSKMAKVEGTWLNDKEERQIHVYHIGFQISTPNIPSIIRYPKYEGIDEVIIQFSQRIMCFLNISYSNISIQQDNYLLPTIFLYRDTKFQHTVAVRYQIILVDVGKKLENTALTYQDSNYFDNKIENFYEIYSSKIEEILSHPSNSEKYQLEIDSLVNENDFLIDTWKITTRYKAYQMLIWSENIEIWRYIEEFARKVATHSFLEVVITTGIGKALAMVDDKGNEKKFEWGEEKEKIFIPELYWKAIESTDLNGNTTGVFVIMHNEPITGQAKVEKICDKNVCFKYKIWNASEHYDKLRGLVYCCSMDAETLRKLGAAFYLKERGVLEGGSIRNTHFPQRIQLLEDF